MGKGWLSVGVILTAAELWKMTVPPPAFFTLVTRWVRATPKLYWLHRTASLIWKVSAGKAFRHIPEVSPVLSAIPSASTRLKFSMPCVTEPPHRPVGGVPGPLSVMSLMKARLCELAPTLVSHGTEAGPPMVPAPGPELPADVATKTPASAANR